MMLCCCVLVRKSYKWWQSDKLLSCQWFSFDQQRKRWLIFKSGGTYSSVKQYTWYWYQVSCFTLKYDHMCLWVFTVHHHSSCWSTVKQWNDDDFSDSLHLCETGNAAVWTLNVMSEENDHLGPYLHFLNKLFSAWLELSAIQLTKMCPPDSRACVKLAQ